MTNSLHISWRSIFAHWALPAGVLMGAMLQANAQLNPGDIGGSPEKDTQLQQLRSDLNEARSEISRTQSQIGQLAAEIEALRRELKEREPLTTQELADQGTKFPSPADLARQQQSGSQRSSESLADLSANQKMLATQVAEVHQTKVESESKYKVKISGIVLFNAFSNRGAVDVVDLPKLALGSEASGTVGASVRQSILGLQVFGPDLAGAATSASISADFFGGYPADQPYGTTLGIVRLRQASAHLDWRNSTLVIGQETLFLSPLSPTSYATLAEPALSYAGNLWAWTPQVVAEHRFHSSDQMYFSVSGGLLAPLSDQVSNQLPYAGYPSAGELARRPAVGAQVAFNTKAYELPLSVGIGGYASELKFAYGRKISSWGVMSFWRIPFGPLFELTGEAYRGKALGGLGGGIWQSVVYNGDPEYPSTNFRPLDAIGGWAQLKFRPHPKWELNAAAGQDNVLAKDLEWAPILVGAYMPPLARNRAIFGNAILRPKSNLLLSVEYRRIWTYGYSGPGNTADQVNVGAGVSF